MTELFHPGDTDFFVLSSTAFISFCWLAHVCGLREANETNLRGKIECFGIVRQVWDGKKAPDGNRDGDDTVHDEQPPPPSETTLSIHAREEPSLEVSTKHLSNRASLL